MRNVSIILTALLAACLCMLSPANADDDTDKSAKEYQVKAAFLYNFIKFAQWPGAQSLTQTHAANICIVGTNTFGNALNLFKQASTTQLALNVIHITSNSQIPSCHVLFISGSEEERVSSLLGIAKSYPILTVSEIKGFVEQGGIIEMVKTEKSIGLFSKDKINLRINVKLAESEGLRLDAQLLEIAAEVIK
jgi:hypothetical protein